VNPIHLLPLGNADRNLVERLSAPLSQAFLVPVEVETANIDIRRFYDGVREQYNSTAVLQYLRDQASNSRLLAVFKDDLFIPILTYVFGEAELGGSVAVISYHRLQNERYGLPPNPSLLVERMCKEALHEMGHVYGLVHCSLQDCVMHASTYVEDIDLKGSLFCAPCRRLLFAHRSTP